MVWIIEPMQKSNIIHEGGTDTIGTPKNIYGFISVKELHA